jgi:hypothetical protein
MIENHITFTIMDMGTMQNQKITLALKFNMKFENGEHRDPESALRSSVRSGPGVARDAWEFQKARSGVHKYFHSAIVTPSGCA